MTGAAQTEEWQALPQRVPRERRSAKRARTDEPNAAGNAVATEAEAAAGAAAAADPPSEAAAAVGGEAGAGPGSEQQQAQQQAGEGEGQHQHEGQAEGIGGVAERPAAGRVDLPAYRSSAVAGEKFECECPALLSTGREAAAAGPCMGWCSHWAHADQAVTCAACLPLPACACLQS